MHNALSRNGKAIINLRHAIESRTGKRIGNRLTSYIYAMERALPAYMVKRREQF
jgi:hypothetical protein